MKSLQPSSQEAARELLARRNARRSLVEYARYIDVPGAPASDDDETENFNPVSTSLAEHHELILNAAQRCIEKHSGRLMIFMPPGSAKSSYGSVVVPSWCMGRTNGYKVIGVSYGADMAKKFGRRTRSIIKQKKYKAIFNTSLSGDQAAADEWALDNTSEYMSGGILSGITGNRADCLVAGTLVETSCGPIAIEKLEHCPPSVKVLSFNHKNDKMEYQDIEAFASRKGIGIYRVNTARGAVVEATGNHPFFTGSGYIKASSLAAGDSLLRFMPERENQDGIRLQQMGSEQYFDKSDYTLSEMLQGSASRFAGEIEQDHVVSVERIGEEAIVFDIQVSKNHNFFANGILVHNCVIIDDPIKGRQDADSEVIRQRTLDEYNESVMTRLKPGGSVIIIQTRWHEGDLAGSILPESYSGESGEILCRDGQVWEVICIAAKCERADDPLGRQIGEYLWPQWFDAEHWKKFERLPRTWSALFQQRPSPDTGDYFKREWIKTIPAQHMPPHETLSIYGGSDYAVTADGGNYTVHAVVGIDSMDKIWLLDLWRRQASSDVWVDAFCDLVRKWKPIGWAEETGQIKSGVGPFLVKRMMQTNAFVAREQFPTRGGDKSVRAQSIRGRIALSGLYVSEDAPFLSDLISEMMSFPVGVYDDQVDALGLVGQLIDKMAIGTTPKLHERTGELGAVYAMPLPRMRR